MTTRTALSTAAGLAILAGLPIWVRTSPAPPPPMVPTAAENAVDLRITFGVKRQKPTTWDGKLTVARGRVLALAGAYFMGPDKVTGPDSWKCATRVTRYADSLTPRAPDPMSTTASELIPNGIVATVSAPASTAIEVATAAGHFTFTLDQLSSGKPAGFLDGDVSVERLPPSIPLSNDPGEGDYPALAHDSRGAIWASWITYQDRADHVWAARRTGDTWEPAVRITTADYPDNFRTALGEDAKGRMWVIWSGKRGASWEIHGRYFAGGKWSAIQKITDAGGPDLYHAVVRDPKGRLHLVWQGFRARESRILWKSFDGERWSKEVAVSAAGNDSWIPSAAADSKGNLWIAWDSYETGNFGVSVRRVRADGQLDEKTRVTRAATFNANVSLAVDRDDRLWIAWDTAEPNWGKDWTSRHFPPEGGNGLYRTRGVRIACLEGGRLLQPVANIMDALPERWRDNFQMVRLQTDANGKIWAFGRALTSFLAKVQNNFGAFGRWEVVWTALEGDRWRPAAKLAGTLGRNDVRVVTARDASGALWAAWSQDGRTFGNSRPARNEVRYTRFVPDGAALPVRLEPFREAPVDAKPVHPNEPVQVAAIRQHRIRAGGKTYRILRGDLHRHTDMSIDGVGDGSLLDFYRYAFSSGQFDFMLVADHNYLEPYAVTGATEYNWWRTEKSEDIFHVAGRFWPMFGTERSVPYPNGHRNTIFARRGIRELPLGPEEQKGQVNSGPLIYPYLRRNGGIATSHSSATDQGTDWRDNDPELEPVVEIYQGLHASYEYEGAPRSETKDKRAFFHGKDWRGDGFVWNAWAKGYKLGVQASSDHIATHDSYACVLVEDKARLTRQDLIDAMKLRHTYAATDNIIVDVRAGDHLMGEAFSTGQTPVLRVRIHGTGPIARVEVIKNQQFVYTARPGAALADFEYRDEGARPGESYYYVRVEQTDGQLAWSSPIWVTYTGPGR
jgi:hypothetical protein